jgi:hypothetical protein
MALHGRETLDVEWLSHTEREKGGRPVENKVVAHMKDGTIRKGYTRDFDPQRARFHLLPAEGGGVPVALELSELKALFYVKDYLGNRDYDPPAGFGPAHPQGRRCIVTFEDGEVIFGSTPDYGPETPGFTLYPSDPADNNVKLFVSTSAVLQIEFPEDA